MTSYVFLLLACLMAVEVVNLVKLLECVRSVAVLVRKVWCVLVSDAISDTWKEKAILMYAVRLIRVCFLILCSLLLICALFFFVAVYDDTFTKLLFSLRGILLSTVFSIVYYRLRFRKLHA